MSATTISVAYTLSKAGQRAQALAGENASRDHVIVVTHGDSTFAPLLPHAILSNDGTAEITHRDQYSNKVIGPIDALCDLDSPLTATRAITLIADWKTKIEADRREVEEAAKARKAEHRAAEAAEAARLLERYPTPENWVIEYENGKPVVRHETGRMRDAYKLPEIVAMQKQARDILYRRRVAEAEAEEAEQAAWITAHGSDRLKSCLAEEIECGAIYWDERLDYERPGWVEYDDVRGHIRDPRNPPSEAFDLLAEAREVAPEAKLVYYPLNGGCYVASEERQGRTILLFADDTYDDDDDDDDDDDE